MYRWVFKKSVALTMIPVTILIKACLEILVCPITNKINPALSLGMFPDDLEFRTNGYICEQSYVD